MTAALRHWAKVAGDPKEMAKAKLLNLSPADKPGNVEHPFPVVDRKKYLAANKAEGVKVGKLADKVKPSLVPLDQLSGIQKSVNAERVADYIDKGGNAPEGKRASGAGNLVDFPLVVKRGGKLTLHDGHHRAIAKKLLGEKTIKARVVDLDAKEEDDAPRA